MQKLERITATLALTLVLSVAALADEPCNPGETHGPPCAAAQVVNDDSIAPGQLETPPAADTVDVITVVEVALIEMLILW